MDAEGAGAASGQLTPVTEILVDDLAGFTTRAADMPGDHGMPVLRQEKTSHRRPRHLRAVTDPQHQY